MKQPICDPCWVYETAEWLPTEDGELVPVSYSIPTVTSGFPLELCCMCGCHTISGIYIRRTPEDVPFPTIIPDETP